MTGMAILSKPIKNVRIMYVKSVFYKYFKILLHTTLTLTQSEFRQKSFNWGYTQNWARPFYSDLCRLAHFCKFNVEVDWLQTINLLFVVVAYCELLHNYNKNINNQKYMLFVVVTYCELLRKFNHIVEFEIRIYSPF